MAQDETIVISACIIYEHIKTMIITPVDSCSHGRRHDLKSKISCSHIKSHSIQSPKSVLCPDYTSPHELKWLCPQSQCNSQFLD